MAQKIKLYSTDIPLALEKYSRTHELEADAAVFLSSMTHVIYMIMSIYFKVLGSSPLFIVGLIHSPVLPYEDSQTYLSTNLTVVGVVRSGLVLGFLFGFVVLGISGMVKLAYDVLLLLTLLNMLILR